MSARFEIVRTDGGQPWHARFVGRNGRIVWTTETYARRGGAVKAITTLCSGDPVRGVDRKWRIRMHDSLVLEIRDVDERTQR